MTLANVFRVPVNWCLPKHCGLRFETVQSRCDWTTKGVVEPVKCQWRIQPRVSLDGTWSLPPEICGLSVSTTSSTSKFSKVMWTLTTPQSSESLQEMYLGLHPHPSHNVPSQNLPVGMQDVGRPRRHSDCSAQFVTVPPALDPSVLREKSASNVYLKHTAPISSSHRCCVGSTLRSMRSSSTVRICGVGTIFLQPSEKNSVPDGRNKHATKTSRATFRSSRTLRRTCQARCLRTPRRRVRRISFKL